MQSVFDVWVARMGTSTERKTVGSFPHKKIFGPFFDQSNNKERLASILPVRRAETKKCSKQWQ